MALLDDKRGYGTVLVTHFDATSDKVTTIAFDRMTYSYDSKQMDIRGSVNRLEMVGTDVEDNLVKILSFKVDELEEARKRIKELEKELVETQRNVEEAEQEEPYEMDLLKEAVSELYFQFVKKEEGCGC